MHRSVRLTVAVAVVVEAWSRAGAAGQRCSPGLAPAVPPGRAVALLLAGWSTAFILGGRCPRESSEDVCWRHKSVFCPKLVVLPIDDSQFPTQSPGPQPRGGDRCAFLQGFGAAFLCVHQSLPSKKAPRGCIFFLVVCEGCGTWPGGSLVCPARCQPAAHPGRSATLEIGTRVLLPACPTTHIQLLRGKEITPCSGSFSHLFLILDDELGALFLDDLLDPDFTPVPKAQPRGPAGESERNPVHEPEGNAGDVNGGGDPASPLSSETETRADGMGLERGKDESNRGKFSQGSYHP
ncbi:uncharacterized protein LOC122167317 [Centrocercus urophasianus]|uniref:uncharacterized protein LOC122167317 n=1 Tax=Centrocercus urophasianus TaxID=9002 RepID=UPI001C64E24B|nr:uncharacterized protein LOC122167317 [Centrocercus urophasianus]